MAKKQEQLRGRAARAGADRDRRPAPHRHRERLRGRGRQGQRAAPRDQLGHRPRAVQRAAHLHRRPGLARPGVHRRPHLAASTRRSPPTARASRTPPRSPACRSTQIRQAAAWIAEPKDGARRRTMFGYEKGLIWGNDNYRTNARAREPGARDRQRRPAGRRLRPPGRPPGGLRAAVGRASSAGPRPTSTSC